MGRAHFQTENCARRKKVGKTDGILLGRMVDAAPGVLVVATGAEQLGGSCLVVDWLYSLSEFPIS